MEQVPVITFDGPGGVGKGTISRILSQELGWHLLDSGALYRGLAYVVNLKNIPTDDANAIVELIQTFDIHFQQEQKNSRSRVVILGEDVTEAIREESCGQIASQIAAHESVRAALLSRQQAFREPPGLVADGRDMGSRVFPDAILKFYLDASLQERAKRRFLQLHESGKNVNMQDVCDEVGERDKRDSARQHDPLMPAEQAIIIDTTNVGIDEVMTSVFEYVREVIKIEK